MIGGQNHMRIFTHLTKHFFATLLLAVTITATIPTIPEKGLPSECSVCNNEDERPCPEKTTPGN